MNKMFYARLAVTNIKKQSKTYVPYIISCILTVVMYYNMILLCFNSGIDGSFIGGSITHEFLQLGVYIIAIFAFIFLFYTHSFLIKRRKREFGLYNVLGMEKGHIARVLMYETLYSLIISLFGGIIIGITLSKLFQLFLFKLLEMDAQEGFIFSGDAVINTVVLFGVIFALIFLNTVRQIHISKPVELLRGSKAGEKEPKAKLFFAILGVLTLGAGYYLAITVSDAISAILIFFLAVILVIIGTYLLFTAGSIALLKLLRKNKRYYYRTNHFISVSSMIYRMKQNAVGLANICILSTMVLVMLSSVITLYFGANDRIEVECPRDFYFESYDADASENIKSAIADVLASNNVKCSNILDYTTIEFSALYHDNKFITDQSSVGNYSIADIVYISVLTIDDYNQITGGNKKIESGEILLGSTSNYYSDAMNIFGKSYPIAERIDYMPTSFISISNCFTVVVDSDETLEYFNKMQNIAYGDSSSNMKLIYGFDTNLQTKEERAELYDRLGEKIDEQIGEQDISVKERSIDITRESVFSLYSGLFFLGIMLSVLFIVAMVLIMYYKQISEGYDDRDRFQIMQKVGLSDREIKKTIKSQVLTVFLLPLIASGIHVAFALKEIYLILRALGFTASMGACALIALAIFAVFALFYVIVYSITAKQCYKTVSES